MSQSLFRLSINTARSIKITSNSSFCECLSCLLLKHCFQFRKICAFFYICFCSRIFCTFQVILRLFSFNFNFNCNRAQLAPQSVRLYCGSALRCQIKFSTLFFWCCMRTPYGSVCIASYTRLIVHVCVLHLSFHFAADTSQSFSLFCDTSQRVCRFFHQFSQRLSKLF